MKNNKTFSVTVRLFTNDLPDKINKRNPAWSCGKVEMQANKEKGIPSVAKHFKNRAEREKAIDAVFKEAGIIILE